MTDAPKLRKARRITGNKLVFRDATEADAAFILKLRTDAQKSRYLSTTPPSLEKQAAWLRSYTQDDSQAYFIIEDRSGKPVGTVRLYDVRGRSFCWGSWIKDDGAPQGFGMESALMLYRYALDLGFDGAHFDVRIGNESVWGFHERMGAVRVKTVEPDHFYEIDRSHLEAAFVQYARYLPDGISVEYL